MHTERWPQFRIGFAAQILVHASGPGVGLGRGLSAGVVLAFGVASAVAAKVARRIFESFMSAARDRFEEDGQYCSDYGWFI